jgi:hypothetical protein
MTMTNEIRELTDTDLEAVCGWGISLFVPSTPTASVQHMHRGDACQQQWERQKIVSA